MAEVWDVPRLWDGGMCFIIGGGPSMPRQFGIPESVIRDVMSWKVRPDAYSEYLRPIHDKHIIGVNNVYQIGTWIDALFFGDSSWYLVHRQALAKWPGLKVSCNPRFSNRHGKELEGVRYIPKDKTKRHGISNNPCVISWNGNSGAAAINLAVHMGVKQIALLGFDMDLDSEGISHWHGQHNRSSTSFKKRKVPSFTRHLMGFEPIANDAQKLGVEILNISVDSKITQFKKVTLNEVLGNS